MAQSVERRIGSAEVTGPIPVSSFDERRFDGISAFLTYWNIYKYPIGKMFGRGRKYDQLNKKKS